MSHIYAIHNAKAEFLPYADKTVAGKDVYEVKLLFDADSIDAQTMRDLRRARSCFVSIDFSQKKLPGVDGEPVQNHPGQLKVTDAINADAQPDGPEPVIYSLLLLELPTEAKQLKAAKKWLRNQTGLKAVDLDAELEHLDAKHPYLVIEKGNEPYVMETRMEMERLGMVVSTHPWAEKSEQAEASQEPEAPEAAGVTLDQLTVGSQWLLKGIGTQVRIHNIQGEKVYFHSLYALYCSLPAWIFAAAVTPSDVLVDLETVDLAKWENVAAKPVQLDEETEARMQLPWLLPVAELPMDAEVEFQGKRWIITDVDAEGGKPEAILYNGDTEQEVKVSVSELVEPLGALELSPLVFHALGNITQAETPAETEAPAELDPTPSTATETEPASDGGEVVGSEEETEDGVEPQEGEAIADFRTDSGDEQEAA